MSKGISIADTDVLLVVDLQYDFCPGGNLAVPQGHDVVEPVNRLARRFANVILTQDWHPSGHQSFASAHPGRQPFEVVEMSYGIQVLWPDHCVQGTRGAELHGDLDVPHAELILRKGYRPAIDSYSALYENDRKTPTGLAGYLRERGLRRVFLAGLAYDFCVRYSAEDLRREGFEAIVFEDACRAIDTDGSMAAAREAMLRVGAGLIQAAEFG